MVRKRGTTPQNPRQKGVARGSHGDGEDEEARVEDVELPWRLLGGWVWWLLGVSVCMAVGYKHSSYMYQLHENQLWFSNIKVSYTTTTRTDYIYI